MFRRSSTHKKLFAALALVTASIGATVISGHSPVHAVSGTGGLIDMNLDANGTQCKASGAIDANSTNWSWTKPTLEYSINGGAYQSATSSIYGLKLCRDVASSAGGMIQAYWFIVQKADGGNDDMDGVADIANTTFKVTIPLKTGDNTTRLTGYSEMVSLSEANGVATVITKPSGLAKVNVNNQFKTNHPECASYADNQMSLCNIQKADRDIKYTVIQHLEYSTSALTSFQQIYKGLWIGANVNGYNVNLQCGALGGDSSNGGGNNGGGNYSGSSDGGANMNSGSSAAKSLEVSVNGTPHFRQDGVTVNTGSLKAFIPGETATKCFGDGADTTTLQTIAEALSVSRTEASENGGAAQSLAAGTAFTAEAVTTPVAGILVKVPEMTFSSPSYKVTSKLATTTTGSTTKALAKGKKAKLKSLITTTKGATLTWSVKGGCKIVGTNLVAAKKAATCTLKVKEKVTKRVNGKKKTTTTSQSVTVTVS